MFMILRVIFIGFIAIKRKFKSLGSITYHRIAIERWLFLSEICKNVIVKLSDLIWMANILTDIDL